MKVTVTVSRAGPSLRELADRHIRDKLFKAERALKLATPVDEGVARNGWEVNEYTLSNNVPYIGILNTGTSKQAAPRFIETALDSVFTPNS